jgi:hypothetical protein
MSGQNSARLRTPAISSRLADFVMASDDLMPRLLPLILRRLVPARGGSLRPWTVHEVGGNYRVDDANGQALAFVYGRDVKVAPQAKPLTWDEARRIAAGIARLPELVAASTPSARHGER